MLDVSPFRRPDRPTVRAGVPGWFWRGLIWTLSGFLVGGILGVFVGKVLWSGKDNANEAVGKKDEKEAESEGLRRRIADLEAGAKTSAVMAADAATALEAAHTRIAAAEAAHKDFKACFLVSNGTAFPITFYTRQRFWDGAMSEWLELKIEPDQTVRMYHPGATSISAKWVNSLVGDEVRWGESFIAGEMRVATEDPSVEQIDCRYRFVLRDRRIELDFLFSVVKK